MSTTSDNGPGDNGADDNGPGGNGADDNGADDNGADANGADANGADADGADGDGGATARAGRLPGRWPWAALVLVLGAVFTVGVYATWDFAVDESYLLLRYSENLADGNGPVFDVGSGAGEAADATGGLGWTVVLAPMIALGADPAVAATVFSVVLGFGVVGGVVRSAWRFSGFAAALVAGAAFVLFLPTYFHLTAGLESAALALVLLRAAVVGLHVLTGRPVRSWEPPALLLLAGLLRPEGALAALPVLLVWWHRGRRERAVWFWTALAASLGAAFVGWHWWFFGRALPVHTGAGLTGSGADWVEATLLAFGPLVVLTGATLLRRSTWAPGVLLLTVVAAGWLPYALSPVGGDFLHRFAFTVFAVLCLGAGLGTDAVLKAGAERGAHGPGSVRRWVPVSAAGFAVAWVVLIGLTPRELPLMANYGPDLRRAQLAIGQGLSVADVPERRRSVAVASAGAIGYASGWDVVDYSGRTGGPVARGEDPTSVVRHARPTVIVVTTRAPVVPRRADGLRVPESTSGYLLLAQVPMRSATWQNVFVLPDYAAPVATALTGSVDRAQRAEDPGRYEPTLARWLDRVAGRL